MRTPVWKRTELKTAARLGGRRVPITGRQRGDVPDVEHPWLSIEVKHRKIVPEWLLDAMRQAIAANKTGQKLPIAVIHRHGDNGDKDLVVMSLKDFRDWFCTEGAGMDG